jgi:hypothetical protein
VSYVEVLRLSERFQALGFGVRLRSWNMWLGSWYLYVYDQHGEALKVFSERQGAITLFRIGEMGWYGRQSA